MALAVLVAGGALSSWGQTTTIILQPNGTNGKDAQLTSARSENNFGGFRGLRARTWGPEEDLKIGRGLIDFDLSSLPDDAVILEAKLTLAPFMQGGVNALSGDNGLTISRIKDSWSEDEVTWKDQPQTDEVLKVNVAASTNQSSYENIDITDLLIERKNNPTANFGLQLKLTNEEEGGIAAFASSDHLDKNKHPKLIVSYIVRDKFSMETAANAANSQEFLKWNHLLKGTSFPGNLPSANQEMQVNLALIYVVHNSMGYDPTQKEYYPMVDRLLEHAFWAFKQHNICLNIVQTDYVSYSISPETSLDDLKNNIPRYSNALNVFIVDNRASFFSNTNYLVDNNNDGIFDSYISGSRPYLGVLGGATGQAGIGENYCGIPIYTVIDDVDLSYNGFSDNVLAHEIGHCLGLWHTFHGGELERVANVPIYTETPCLDDPFLGTDDDLRGDYVVDTEEDYRLYNSVLESSDCTQNYDPNGFTIGLNSSCSGSNQFMHTDYTPIWNNVMSYHREAGCAFEFTEGQAERMKTMLLNVPDLIGLSHDQILTCENCEYNYTKPTTLLPIAINNIEIVRSNICGYNGEQPYVEVQTYSSVTHDYYKWYVNGTYYGRSDDGTITISLPSFPNSFSIGVQAFSTNCDASNLYAQSFGINGTPLTPSIDMPSTYCGGVGTSFSISNPIPNVEYVWEFQPWGMPALTVTQSGLNKTSFTPDFGSVGAVCNNGNTSVGTVTDFTISVYARNCTSTGDPNVAIVGSPNYFTTWNIINVSYGNCCSGGGGSGAFRMGVGETENSPSKIGVYPNPSASGIFYVQFSGFQTHKAIQVIDLVGRTVYQMETTDSKVSLDLSNYAEGVYFIKTSDGSTQQTTRIIFE